MNSTTADPSVKDILVIGGGLAGLSAASTLARQAHTCVIFDSESYRNGPSKHMHTVPTWDHKDPAEWRAVARNDLLARYPMVSIEKAEVKALKQGDGDIFTATDSNGKEWHGRKIILATGVVDVFPDIEGYADCWVSGIFHCLFCHGYEEQHADSSGVLAVDDMGNALFALHLARSALRLTPKKATIYTNGATELAKEIEVQVSASGVSTLHVDSRAIARFEKAPKAAEVTIHFKDGSSVTEGFLAHKPKNALKGDLAQQLKLEMTPQGDVQATPPFYQSSVRGVFIAGDNAGPMKTANGAIFMGSAAGAGATCQLQADDLGMKGIV